MSSRTDLLSDLTAGDVVRVFIGTMVPLLFVVVGVSAADMIHETELARVLYVVQAHLSALIILLGVYLFAVAKGDGSWASVGFRACHADWLIRAGILGIMLYGLHLLFEAGLLAVGIERIAYEPLQTDSDVFKSGSIALSASLGAAILIATPLAEEAFQRGVLFGWLRRHLGFVASAAASAIVFGGFHIELFRPGAAVVFGLCAAWLYERSYSLWPSIVLHVVVNGGYLLTVLAW